MKILNSIQIHNVDNITVEEEPILSIDLMERAATQLFNFIVDKYRSCIPITIFVGSGNNGGDALALARLLSVAKYKVRVFILKIGHSTSPNFEINYNKLVAIGNVKIETIEQEKQFPIIVTESIIVDGIFGSGLSRETSGLAAVIIDKINSLANQVISIDIPSGLFIENNVQNKGSIIKANYTLSFELPKFAFFMPENYKFVRTWKVLPIGLSLKAIDNEQVTNYYQTIYDIPLLINREQFSHKGTYGHALLVAGNYGKVGAAIIAAKACLRCGVGLLSVHLPQSYSAIIHNAIPEAMLLIDETEQNYCSINSLAKFNAIGVGPGIGTKTSTINSLKTLLGNSNKPLVIDADGLNIISQNKYLLNSIPKYSILTPHPKEFDRLFGEHNSRYDRIETAIKIATTKNIIIVLKGAYTAIININGNVFFNSTGNPALAKGGSGDALTGVILGLLASGYSSIDSAKLGVFVHGLATDIALNDYSQESLLISDVIDYLGHAFQKVRLFQQKQ